MTEDQRTLLIRADAGLTIGAGHVMRCLAIGQAFQDIGWQVHLVAAELPVALEQRLLAEGVVVHRITAAIGSDADRLATVGTAVDVAATVLLVDGYGFDQDWRRAVKRHGLPVLVMDDAGAEPVHGDVVINARADAATLPYNRLAPGALLLLGPAYAPLRREIRQAAAGALPCLSRGDRVLVSFGGSDPLAMTLPVAVSLLVALPDVVMLDVVIGGAAADPGGVADALAALGPRVTVYRDAPDMGRLMADAALAVSAAGTTTAELAATGTPTLLVTVADNQLAGAAQSAALGCCALVDGRQPDAITAIGQVAAGLWLDAASRQAMASKAARLVDGQGAPRIAAAVSDLISQR